MKSIITLMLCVCVSAAFSQNTAEWTKSYNKIRVFLNDEGGNGQVATLKFKDDRVVYHYPTGNIYVAEDFANADDNEKTPLTFIDHSFDDFYLRHGTQYTLFYNQAFFTGFASSNLADHKVVHKDGKTFLLKDFNKEKIIHQALPIEELDGDLLWTVNEDRSFWLANKGKQLKSDTYLHSEKGIVYYDSLASQLYLLPNYKEAMPQKVYEASNFETKSGYAGMRGDGKSAMFYLYTNQGPAIDGLTHHYMQDTSKIALYYPKKDEFYICDYPDKQGGLFYPEKVDMPASDVFWMKDEKGIFWIYDQNGFLKNIESNKKSENGEHEILILKDGTQVEITGYYNKASFTLHPAKKL